MTKANEKRTYCTPQLISISLDNEISLALQSFGDPGEPGPGEPVAQIYPEYFKMDPLVPNNG
ncbi:MAG: hypothetical protein ACOYM7_07500 [Paludibacter sp.]